MHVTPTTSSNTPPPRHHVRLIAAASTIVLLGATALGSPAAAASRNALRDARARTGAAGAAPSAALAVTIADNPDPVATGQLVTYHVDVHNAGPQMATGVSLSDHLPSG